LKRNLFRDVYGYEGCKLVVVPPLPGAPALIKANKVSLIGDRGVYSLAEIIGIDLAKG
jgi:hypothetical protein